MKRAVPSLLVCLGLLAWGLSGLVAAAKENYEAKGDAAYQQADYKKAVKEFKKAVKQAPNEARLHYKLAQAFFKKGELDEAMAEYIRTTNLDPNHEGAYQFIGDFFLTKNEFDKAAKAYENLVRIRPDSAPYHFQLAKLQDRQMQNEPALEHYYRAIVLNPAIEDAYPPLFKLLRLKILQDPQNPDTHVVLGRVHKLHKDYQEAKVQFAVAVQLQPRDREAWLELLEVCRTLQDCNGEISALEGLLSFNPKDTGLIDQVLAAARRCDLRDVAIRYLQAKIALRPDDCPAYAELGNLNRKAENRVQAYFYLRQYLELCPGGPDAAEFRKWIQNEELANPAIGAQYRAFGLFQAGVTAFKGGQFAEALRQLEASRAAYPDFPQLHFYLGQTLEELNRRFDALFAYKEAIKLQPGNAEYWFFLGSALHQESRLADAAVCFQKVLQVDPRNASGYLPRAEKILQSYREQGIIKPEPIIR